MALMDDFIARFSEFDSAAVTTAWPALEAMWPCYYKFTYGSSNCVNEAIFQLIAHLFVVTSSESSAAKKVVSGQSVGSVSQSFAVVVPANGRKEFFGSTKYGQQFLVLTASRQGAFFV